MPGKATIQTKGILHFTVSVRDHIKAAEYYSELLGCEVERTSDHFAFMKCGDDHFVLSKMPNHVNPNPPGGTWFRQTLSLSTGEVTVQGRSGNSSVNVTVFASQGAAPPASIHVVVEASPPVAVAVEALPWRVDGTSSAVPRGTCKCGPYLSTCAAAPCLLAGPRPYDALPRSGTVQTHADSLAAFQSFALAKRGSRSSIYELGC